MFIIINYEYHIVNLKKEFYRSQYRGTREMDNLLNHL